MGFVNVKFLCLLGLVALILILELAAAPSPWYAPLSFPFSLSLPLPLTQGLNFGLISPFPILPIVDDPINQSFNKSIL